MDELNAHALKAKMQKKIALLKGAHMARMLSGAALISVLGAMAAPQESDEKIGNKPASLKEAFKSSGLQNEASGLAGDADLTKIAALDKDGMKGEAALNQPQLAGDFVQGGLVLGQTLPGSRVRLDDIRVAVDTQGQFILGFHRDHPQSALLTITYPDGTTASKVLDIADREFKIQRIDGLPSNKVSTFSKEDLDKIKISTDKKKSARAATQDAADWAAGFEWPVTGRISGVFGSQRVLNGEEKRPHSGVDVAAPTGTTIKSPAAGIIRLADMDMFFEGGLVLIDHGQGLESALMHMSRIDVKAGDRVEKGTPIGAVGATGRATGPHLHWSLKWKSRLLDAQLVVGEMPGT